jgi:hypothetical protein
MDEPNPEIQINGTLISGGFSAHSTVQTLMME